MCIYHFKVYMYFRRIMLHVYVHVSTCIFLRRLDEEINSPDGHLYVCRVSRRIVCYVEFVYQIITSCYLFEKEIKISINNMSSSKQVQAYSIATDGITIN